MNKLEIRIAKIISFIFHPLLIPTYAVGIIFSLKYFFFYILPLQAKIVLLANVFGFTFLIPAFAIFFMNKYSLIRSYYMDLKNDRVLPLITSSVFYFMTYYLFKNVNLSSLLYSFFLVSSIISILALIINFFWKISLHSIALGGLTGLFLSLFLKFNMDTRLWLLLILLISGITGTARLILNSHTPSQIYAGFLIGLSVMFSFYMFLI
jgi:hypothetical protein